MPARRLFREIAYKSFCFAAALALSAPAGQPVPAAREAAPAVDSVVNADPALWVVRDEDTTIYLFGTFHLLDDRAWLNDEVKIAFDESRELVLEAIIPDDPAAIQPMILRYAVDTRGRRLSQRLNEQQNATLSEALAGLGVPADAFERLEPWFVSMTLATVAGQRLGISAAQGPETVLLEAAREREMTVAELEGLEWQIRLFDEMPDEHISTSCHASLVR